MDENADESIMPILIRDSDYAGNCAIFGTRCLSHCLGGPTLAANFRDHFNDFQSMSKFINLRPSLIFDREMMPGNRFRLPRPNHTSSFFMDLSGGTSV